MNPVKSCTTYRRNENDVAELSQYLHPPEVHLHETNGIRTPVKSMSLAVASRQLWSSSNHLRATKRGDGVWGIERMATGVLGAKVAPPVPHLQAHQPALRGQHVPHLPRPPLPPGGHNQAPLPPCRFDPSNAIERPSSRQKRSPEFSVPSSHASDVLCFGVARNSARWPHGSWNPIYIFFGLRRSILLC